MTKKKTLKFAAALTALVLLGLLLWFAQGLLGNPVSRMLADRAAENYLAQTYPGMDLTAAEANYNFKIGGYSVQVSSPASVDTHFSLEYNLWGKLQYDSYESYVTSGWNTWERLENEYRQLADGVFSAPDFPFTSDIDYGTISSKDEEVGGAPGSNAPSLDMGSLILDQDYDIREIGAQYGQIVYYFQEEGTPTVERAAEVLRVLKERFDTAGVPFCSIDLTLEEPLPESDKPGLSRETLSVGSIRSEEITKADLEERVAASVRAMAAYYAEQDALKNGEK